MITVTALHIYPIKSCGGIAIERGLLTDKGFAYDREWLIVRDDGKFVTQREHPRMALIETAIDADALTLNAPGMQSLVVPLAERGAPTQVICWKDLCAAHDSGDLAAQWLTHFLGAAHRLVRFDPAHKRASSLDWTGGREALNQFSDGFPWLLISQGSLIDLNSRLPQPLPMNRFRPNIVIDGVGAFDEDRLDELQIARARFKVVKGCTRCIITTTDQATAERDGVETFMSAMLTFFVMIVTEMSRSTKGSFGAGRANRFRGRYILASPFGLQTITGLRSRGKICCPCARAEAEMLEGQDGPGCLPWRAKGPVRETQPWQANLSTNAAAGSGTTARWCRGRTPRCMC